MKTVMLVCILSLLVSMGIANAAEIGITDPAPVDSGSGNEGVPVSIGIDTPNVTISATLPKQAYDIEANVTAGKISGEMNVTPGSLEIPAEVNISGETGLYITIDPSRLVTISRNETGEGKSVQVTAPVPSTGSRAAIPAKAAPVSAVQRIVISNLSISTANEATIVAAEMERAGKRSAFRIEKTGEKISLESGGVRAETENSLEVDMAGVFIKNGDKREVINVLPDETKEAVSGIIDSVKIMKIELEDEPVYSVRGEKSGNLLWVLPVTFEASAKVNAKTGDVGDVANPWWSFMVF
jgi:hypothetical protein